MSGKRSCHKSCKVKKQTFSSTTKAKLQSPASHVDGLLQENHPVQHLSLSTQVFLPVIIKYMTTNILQLVSNKAHNNCRVQRAVDNNPELSHHFKDDTNSLVDEEF